MIYIIKGKNGSGKTFLAEHLYELGFNRSISYTTREPRKNEVNGYDYEFVSKEEFVTKIKENFFIEYQLVNGNYYGTPLKNIKDGVILVSSDKNPIEKYCKGDIITFYIDAPLELRYKRVVERGTSEEEIFKRFSEENNSFLYDFKACFINNGDEKQSLRQIIDNIKKPKLEDNRSFLHETIKNYKPLESDDELLIFLQFEEFLMRGIYLDNKIKNEDINTVYFKYMQKFLHNRNISFNRNEDGDYTVILNGNKYRIDKRTAIKKEEKGEKEVNEKEID